MTGSQSFFDRLRRAKLIQWAVAYLAGAWLILQVVDVLRQTYGWTTMGQQAVVVLLVVGFVAALIVAWYHGEKGEQKVTGIEVGLLAVLLFIAATGVTFVAGSTAPPPLGAGSPESGGVLPDVDPKSVAVLPFQSLSDDPGDGYFADGIHEDILTHLSKVGDLKVISRTSVLRYRNATEGIPEIGRQLGVATALEGSVRRDGDRVRVTAQLIDARTDEHIWAETYDRRITDIFELQTEVAHRIVAALRVTLTAGERSRLEITPTTTPRAYDFYLQARQYSGRPGNELQDLLAAEQLYLRSLEEDPEFGEAYASLSRVHAAMYWYAHDRSEGRIQRARSMLEEARRLAPASAETYRASGYFHYWAERDYARAQAEFERALAVLPGSSEIMSGIAFLERRRGNWEAAAEGLRRAAALDPRNANVVRNLAETLEFMKRYAEADRAYRDALELAPDLHVAALHLAFLHLRWQGTTDSLRATLRRLPPDYEPTLGLVQPATRVHLALLDRDPAEALRQLDRAGRDVYEHQRFYYPADLLRAFAHELAGDDARARAAYDSARVLLEAARVRRPEDPRIHSALGLAYSGLGRRQDAVRAGRRAVEILPLTTDALDGTVYEIELASIYARTGNHGAALAAIARLLETPTGLNPHELRLDPRWDPLRSLPAFQRLAAGSESVVPPR
jgi:TolB-like protein/Flp pilus assembly protein TadD